MEKYTIRNFNQDFPDDDACLTLVVDLVYPEGIPCRKCGVERPHHRLHNRPKAFSCQVCGTHVYPLAGTIFEKSTTPLKSWFYAMFLMSSTRCGISAKQLERELGVTYKTAWRMFSQLRKLLGVAAKQKDKARQALQRSADQAGFFSQGRERLVAPAIFTTTPPIQRKSDEDGGNRSGGVGGSGPQLPTLIKGLIEKLPPEGDVWYEPEQKQWLDTAKMIFGLIYKTERKLLTSPQNGSHSDNGPSGGLAE